MRQTYLFTLLYLTCSHVSSTLHFNNDGSFKILQVSDEHFRDGEDSECSDVAADFGKCSALNTTYFLSRVLDSENPDLVIFTGDLIDWKSSDAKWSLDQVTNEVIKRNIYWAAVLGNHDGESTLSREEVIKYLSEKDYSLTQLGPVDVYGYGNYFEYIYQNDNKNIELIFLDSGAYDKYNLTSDSDYDWVHASQLEYIKNSTTNELFKLAFFHIPLQEYTETLDSNPASGQKQERSSPSPLNGGLFAGLMDIPNVIGAFVGHDHLNDYCSLYNGIQLCYAGGAGYTIYGKAGWPRRQRVINIKDKGTIVETYKVLDDNNLTNIDFEVIYSHNDPDLVASYMTQRNMLIFHEWSIYQILTLVFGSLFAISLMCFAYIYRKKLKSFSKTCLNKLANCCGNCLICYSKCCFKCEDIYKNFKKKKTPIEGTEELLNEPEQDKSRDIYKNVSNL